MTGRKYGSLKARWYHIGLFALGVGPGCACGPEAIRAKHGADVPPPPEPNGSSVHQWIEAQAAKAEASDFVVFLDEWFKGGTELGPHGHYHLTQMVRRLPTVPF